MLQFGDNGLLKKSKEAVDKSKLAQTEELIKIDLLAAYIDAELAGQDKPSNETIKGIVEKHGGTIDESNPNVIQTPNGEIKLDEILNDTSLDTKDPDEINKTVEELNKQINELKGQLATESNKREELETQITELQTQVADWKKKAEDGEITLEEKNTEISNLNNQITAKNVELDEKNNEIQELNESVTTITSQKDKLETQVANLEGEITEKNQTIADKEGTITSLNTRIDELNTSITDLNGQLTQVNSDKQTLQDEVTNLNSQVASWKKKAEDGEATIAQRDATISSLNDQITAKNADITAKAQTINDLNGQITTLTTQKNSLETQVANLQKTQATGNATASDVLAGKTFSNGSSVGLTGTMVNRGTLNFNPTGATTQTIEPGYYEGGTASTVLALQSSVQKIVQASSSELFSVSQIGTRYWKNTIKITPLVDGLTISGVIYFNVQVHQTGQDSYGAQTFSSCSTEPHIVDVGTNINGNEAPKSKRPLAINLSTSEEVYFTTAGVPSGFSLDNCYVVYSMY